MMFLIFISMLLAFFIGGTLVAIMSKKLLQRRSLEEFFVGGYRVSGFLSAMTYAATTYSAFMMVGLAGLTFATGVAALGFELAYLVATIALLTIVGPTIWRMAIRNRWLSPSEMISDLYGSNTIGAAIAILYLFAMTPYVAAQFKGIGEIFAALGIDYNIGAAFGAALTAIWIIIAGLWSVVTTDAYQGMWMIIAALATAIWVFLYLLPSNNIDISTALNILTNSPSGNLLSFLWSPSTFIGYTIPWIFFAVTNPQVVQRLFIPRDSKAYKRMVLLFSLYGFSYTVLCVALGLAFRPYIATAFPQLVNQFIRYRDSLTPFVLGHSHPLLASFAYVGIIAASISTADSIVLSVASSVVRDLYERISKKRDERVSNMLSALSIVFLTIVSLLIALQRVGYIVDLSVTTSALLLPLAPITIVGIYRKPGRKALPYALISLGVGISISVYTIVIYGPTRVLTQPILLGLPAPFWIILTSTAALLPIVL